MKPGRLRFGKALSTIAIAGLAWLSPLPVLSAQADPGRTRRIAETQHEIVMLLIKKKEFAQAAEEADRIFRMRWPDDQESLLLKELLGLSDEFRHCSQHAIALRLIENHLAIFKNPAHKAAIWKDKGYIYESLGEHDKAIECFREAQRLEKTISEKKNPIR